MTDVDVITTRYGNKKQRSETHKAATVMTTMYNAGLTFEASKLVIEDLSGFHGRTVGNAEKRVLTSHFFHELKAGKASEDPSAKALKRLFL